MTAEDAHPLPTSMMSEVRDEADDDEDDDDDDDNDDDNGGYIFN